MHDETDLGRFLEAQARDYPQALSEIRAGKKRSHWMWYIFPQLVGLGRSEMARRYGIKDMAEATAYLSHPLLRGRMIEICKALLSLPGDNATHVMGSPDDLKLRSSMTLFSMVPHTDPVFNRVLSKYFGGEKDEATIGLL